MIANRLKHIQPSATFTIIAKVKELKAAGKNIISLSAGEPDFSPPDEVKLAAITAIKNNKNKYTAVDGIVELKEEIKKVTKNDLNLNYDLNEIIVSTGAKQSIYNAIHALINEGDEVIIPSPYWVSYPDMVLLAGGKPVIMPTTINDSFLFSVEKLEELITPNTKLLILNSPSNPSGQKLSKSFLQSVAALLKKHPHVNIITDDIYQYISWNDELYNIVSLNNELKDRTIIINGVSKSYAMTGWRIGYALGPKNIIAAMKKIQSQCTSSPNTIAQYAAIAALCTPYEEIKSIAKTFELRHEICFSKLDSIPNIQVIPSSGTFYIFPNITNILDNMNLKSDVEFCSNFLDEQGVSLVPGTAFGNPGYVRVSFANSETKIQEALSKMLSFCTRK